MKNEYNIYKFDINFRIVLYVFSICNQFAEVYFGGFLFIHRYCFS